MSMPRSIRSRASLPKLQPKLSVIGAHPTEAAENHQYMRNNSCVKGQQGNQRYRAGKRGQMMLKAMRRLWSRQDDPGEQPDEWAAKLQRSSQNSVAAAGEAIGVAQGRARWRSLRPQ